MCSAACRIFVAVSGATPFSALATPLWRIASDAENHDCPKPESTPRSSPVRKLRAILTVLLCLTVPVAGWASVLSGPLCPQLHQHASQEAATLDQFAPAASTSEHHHEHCGGMPSHGKPCKGDHCACGCGIGACLSSTLSLLPPTPASFAKHAGEQLVALTDEPSYAVVRDSSPLRPPIS